VGDLGSTPGLGRSPGEGKGYTFQYSGLENSMDYIVHGVTKSQTRLNKFHFHFSNQTCSPHPLGDGGGVGGDDGGGGGEGQPSQDPSHFLPCP